MLQYVILCIVLITLVFIFSAFRPSETKKITEGLYVIGCGFVNFYALKTANCVILFDTGMSSASAKRGLKKLGISADEVTHIFLTHTDYDHAGGVQAFPKAGVYIARDEEQMINGKTARRGFMHNPRLSSYKTIEDNETVVVDGTCIQARTAPGHTPGSVIYLMDNRYLATGDLLRVSRKGNIKPFLWLMNMNHRQNIQSIHEAQTAIESAEYILTGHTGFFKRSKAMDNAVC